MTKNYNRSYLYSFEELTKDQQNQVLGNYFADISAAMEDQFVISELENREEIIPLSMFIKTNGNKFSHGIFSDSYFSGYFITLNRFCDEAVIAYKYF